MKKKSAKKSASAFKDRIREIEGFLQTVTASGIPEPYRTWSYDYAVIRLYREFEALILNCLVAAINNDTSHLSSTTGITFPKHLTDEVCEYVIVGDGYFDFRGRDGLIQTVRRFLPETHYLVKIAKDPAYRSTLDRLSALRNFAAHNSGKSKAAALKAIGAYYLSASGAWLQTQNRFRHIVASLGSMSDDIIKNAPY